MDEKDTEKLLPGQWESLLRSLAKNVNCYVRWKEYVLGDVTEDASGNVLGDATRRSYTAELAALVPKGSKTALPMGLDLELWERKRASVYETLAYKEPGRPLWFNASTNRVETREAAARLLLENLSGAAVGFADYSASVEPNADRLERFIPLFNVPEFSSPEELAIKFAAMG